MTSLSDLLAKARAVLADSPGPWRLEPDDRNGQWCVTDDEGHTVVREDDGGMDEPLAAFIAAANPATIIELVERVERLDERVNSIPALLDNINHLTKAINEMPEWERAVKAASSNELFQLRAALKEACDLAVSMASDSWRDDPEFDRIAELRKLTSDD
jgi:hypothetical protein